MKKSQWSALRLPAVTTLVIIASAVTVVTAQAAYIVNATETGGDVVFAGSGSLNTSAWTLNVAQNQGCAILPNASFCGGGPTTIADRYTIPLTDFAGPDSIGTGTSLVFSTSGTGDFTSLWFAGGSAGTMYVAPGYVSEAALDGTATYAAATFAGLGLTPGTYEWTWGSGASADSLTLNVGAVPIPAAAWLFGSGLLGLIGVARRKKA